MDVFDRMADKLALWLLIFIGIGIALLIGVLVAIAYYLLLLLAYYFRYKKYRSLAVETVHDELQLHGDMTAQQLVQNLWGVGVAVPEEATQDAVFGMWVAGS